MNVHAWQNFAWTDERADDLTRMWADGWSDQQIADKLGTSRNSVIGKRHRLDLPLRVKESNGKPARTKKKRPNNNPFGFNQFKITRGYDHGDGALAQRIRNRGLAPRPPCHAPRPEAADEPTSLDLTLMEITDQQCHWSASERGPYLFCGHKTWGGTSWCEHHHARVFRCDAA